MLSNRIDLTEHHDFGGGHQRFRLNTLLVDRWYDDDAISPDEYDHMVWWESIFGKFRHTNEKRTVFNKDEAYEKELRNYCQRCGKELRMPWKRFYDLCEECNYIVECDGERIPWKAYKKEGEEASPVTMASDLFSLR